MTAKIIYSGTTHNIGGSNGSTRSVDGLFDFQLSDPHPAAENFFGAVWSGCFMGAIGLAAAQKKVALPQAPSIDAKIDLVMQGSEFILRAKLDITVPGIDIELARELVEVAHEICPYSKATRGNIDVEINVIEPAFA